VSVTPVIPRHQVERDVEAAIEHYLKAVGEKAAPGFIDALQAVYVQTAHHPESGSPRYAHELGLPGLRSLLLKGSRTWSSM